MKLTRFKFIVSGTALLAMLGLFLPVSQAQNWWNVAPPAEESPTPDMEPLTPSEQTRPLEPAPAFDEPTPYSVDPFARPAPDTPQTAPPAEDPFLQSGQQPQQEPPLFEKNMVEIPPPPAPSGLEPGDFRDPFFYVRGYRENARKVLKPGTTVDGLRFNSYSETSGFIENYYRDSNFSLEEVFGAIPLENKKGGCLTCHRGIEKISDNHAFSCTRCHAGNARARKLPDAHAGMVSNPSDLEHAPRFCGKCHEEQIRKVRSSLMATTRGLIELTRHTWGAPALVQPKTPARDPDSDTPPGPPVWTYDNPGHLVDDFLNKKCLRCHVQGTAPRRPGDYRATGCAACHMIYSNDGLTLSRDRAIQKRQKAELKKHRERFDLDYASNALRNRRGYPVIHRFTVAVPSVQCEHCHNNNGVGNEYEGLFGKPARPRPSHQVVDGNRPVLYGREHEFLIPDIHREKGLHCVDCHGASEVKADASTSATLHEAVTVRCETCHGTHSRAPEGFKLVESDPRAKELLDRNQLNRNLRKKVKMGDIVMLGPNNEPLPHVVLQKNRWILYSKVTGKPHTVPVLKHLKSMPLAHQVGRHMSKVECAACHARWSAAEWGLHAIRGQDLDAEVWQDWSFSDPSLQQIQRDQKIPPGNPMPQGMPLWQTAREQSVGLTATWTPGVWKNIITEGDWSSLILGRNTRGKVTILKPRFQYFITNHLVDSNAPLSRAQVPITSDGSPGLALVPHTPHTIRPTGRNCESCHHNELAAGLGDPKRERIENGGEFLATLRATQQVTPQFQIKQMETVDGVPLQTTLPDPKVRFLNPKEIRRLSRANTRYKAYRYLDVRKKNFSRLLIREAYPFDERHEQNEAKYGPPPEEQELLYYDLNDRRFHKKKPPLPPAAPDAGIEPKPGTQDPDSQQENSLFDFFRNLGAQGE